MTRWAFCEATPSSASNEEPSKRRSAVISRICVHREASLYSHRRAARRARFAVAVGRARGGDTVAAHWSHDVCLSGDDVLLSGAGRSRQQDGVPIVGQEGRSLEPWAVSSAVLDGELDTGQCAKRSPSFRPYALQPVIVVADAAAAFAANARLGLSRNTMETWGGDFIRVP